MKPFWKSWTLWANALFILGLLLQVIVKSYVLPPDVQMLIITVANMLLRLRTTTGVSFTNVPALPVAPEAPSAADATTPQ